MEPYIIAFIGSHEVFESEHVLKKLISFLKTYFDRDEYEPKQIYPVFYCGGYGHFSQLASEAIDILRKQFPEEKSEKLFITPYIAPSYQSTLEYMKQFYDDIIYPPLENVPAKFAISRRNQWMIDNCDLLVTYMCNPFGNTRKCINYANRKNTLIYYIENGRLDMNCDSF